MKARIEKKLSKRLIEIAPEIFQRVWLDKECSELAYEQRTRVSNVWSTGGGTDYWGEGLEAVYTLWADWLNIWPWVGDFAYYPEGHKFEHYPNTDGFKPTTINLLRLAETCQNSR